MLAGDWWKTLVLTAATLACSPAPPAQDAEFVQLASSYIEDYLERYPEYATALGDHRHDSRLNDYTADGVADSVAWNRSYLAELEQLDPQQLSVGNAVDLEILTNEIRYSIWAAEELREHTWNPMRYGAGNALYSLLAREFAPLGERLASFRDRLEALPAVFEAARDNLRNPPRIHTETAIRQNDGAIALVRDDLETILAAAPELAEPLAAPRARAVAVMEAHGDWLREHLLPRADGEFRIGADRFRTKLAFTLHSDLSMEEILERAQRRLGELQDALHETALSLYGDAAARTGTAAPAEPSAVIRTVLDSLADEHPTDRSIVDDAQQALEELTTFTRERNLVSVPDEPLQIIIMPEFRRGVSTAYCDSPGPLETGGETFYAISPTPESWTPQRKLSFYREYNDYMLQTLTAHEAIPGHYLQIAHSNRLPAPTDVRSIFSSGTFVEGWAVYSEQLLAEHGYGGAKFRMQQLKMQTRAVINAILDQGIHAGTMTEDEAMDLMLREGFQEEGEAAGKWIRAQLTSAQLSTYFVGISEHEDLRRAWQERHGASADPLAHGYHDKVLSFGSPPAKFVRRLMGL